MNLLNKINAKSKRIIFIDSNHTIEDEDGINKQIELADILSGKAVNDGKYKKYNYCNVYKRQ